MLWVPTGSMVSFSVFSSCSNESEELSYGLGDLHLPLGWGNIPFEKISDKLIFPKGLIMVLEIQERFIDYIPETIKKARYLFNKAKILNGV